MNGSPGHNPPKPRAGLPGPRASPECSVEHNYVVSPSRLLNFGNLLSRDSEPETVCLTQRGLSHRLLKRLRPHFGLIQCKHIRSRQRDLFYCSIQLIWLKSSWTPPVVAPECYSYSSCAGGLNVGIAVKCAETHVLHTGKHVQARSGAARLTHRHANTHASPLSTLSPFVPSPSYPAFRSQSPSTPPQLDAPRCVCAASVSLR